MSSRVAAAFIVLMAVSFESAAAEPDAAVPVTTPPAEPAAPVTTPGAEPAAPVTTPAAEPPPVAPKGETPASVPATEPVVEAAVAAPVKPSPDASPHGGTPDAIAGLPIWNNIQLHGRFDLNFERVNFSGNPLDGDSRFQNYHHLLFLVRESKDDPVTFNLEIIEQRWYEIAYRIAPKDKPWRILAKAGKILMPFGSDPLYHHMYGGRAGFDQTLLPVIWSQLGTNVNAQYRIGNVRLASDTYVVQGYKLTRADAILNLQSDFSSADDMRLGFGERIALAYGPMTAYYSAYANALGFGRHLFMQAFDLSLGRMRGVPILEHMTFDVGVIRADVSGGASRGFGGPNDDYYHFADYLLIRYYITEWLYVQARTGIKTIANKRGLFIDRQNLDQRDTTSHNIGIVARYRGLSGGLYQFWDFERRNEIANDMFRLAVVYEF